MRRWAVLGLLQLLIAATLMAAQGTILLDETTFTLSEDLNGELQFHQIIQIEGEEANHAGRIQIYTNDYTTLKNARIVVRDGNGKVLSKYRRKDFKEIKYSGESILVSDANYFVVNVTRSVFPYEIEMEATLELESLFFWPDWSPQSALPVKQASYTLNNPHRIPFSLLAPHTAMEPVELSPTHAVWRLENLPEFPDEDLAPPEAADRYVLLFSADTLTLDGNSTGFRSWSDVGQFYHALAAEQQDLQVNPAGLVFDTAATHREIVTDIYRYIQEEYRYVAVELGIHGWKPHTASSCLANRYGDCKDLANLCINLLNNAGVEAYPVLINTRFNGFVYPGLPRDSFNHVIVQVPMVGDTLWLDCTTTMATVDRLPAQDQGCNVVVVKEGASYLTTTPIYPAETNRWTFTADGTLTARGDLTFESRVEITGQRAHDLRYTFTNNDPQTQREIVVDWFTDHLPTAQLTDITIENVDSIDEGIVIRCSLAAPGYGQCVGNRIIVNPHVFFRSSWTGDDVDTRECGVFLRYPYSIAATMSFNLPEGYEIEAVHADTALQNDLGALGLSTRLEGTALEVSWSYSNDFRSIPVEHYPAFLDLRETAERLTHTPFMIKK